MKNLITQLEEIIEEEEIENVNFEKIKKNNKKTKQKEKEKNKQTI